MRLSAALQSLFRTLFSPGKEEAPHIMDARHLIADVVQREEFKGLIISWAERLLSTDTRFLKKRLEDLESCRIEKISHYRQGGSIAHEFIVVHIRAGDDERVARLERFKESKPGGTST